MAEPLSDLSDDAEISVDDEVTLSKDLGLFDATMIGVGAMIGAGIFVLTGIAAGIAGPGLVLVFLLNGLLTLPTLMVYAELGSAYHSAGGGYLWIKDALRQPFGFLGGWMDWFAHIVASALYAVGFGGYFVWLLASLDFHPFGLPAGLLAKVLAVFIVGIFTFINFYGVKETVKVENIVTILKLVALGLFIFFGIKAMLTQPNLSDRFFPMLPEGIKSLGSIFMAMGLTFIAFEGYEIIAQSSEEIKNPKRNIPLAMFISILIVIPIYFLISIVALGAINPPTAGMTIGAYLGSLKELAILEGSRQFMPFGGIIILIGGLLSTMSALNATIYSSSRVAFAMARENNLPAIFKRISRKRRTPTVAIIGSSIMVALMAVALPLEDVASAAAVMFLFLFILVNISILKLRRTTKHLDYGFRVPWFPAVPLIGIAGQLSILFFLFLYSPRSWLTGVLWIGVGLLVYYMYAQKREADAEGPKVLYEEIISAKEFTVLMPVMNPHDARNLPKLAMPLAKEKRGEVFALNVVEVPRQLGITEGRMFLKEGKPLLEEVVKYCRDHDVPVATSIRLGRSFGRAIRDVARERNANMLFVNSEHPDLMPGLFGNDIDNLLNNPPCDIGVTHFRGDLGPIKKILVPTTGSANSQLAAEIAVAIAKSTKDRVRVDALYVAGTDSPEKEVERGEQIINQTVANLGYTIRSRIISADNVEEAILWEAKKYDLVVLGATREKFFESLLAGKITEVIARRCPVPVIITRRKSRPVKAVLKETVLEAPKPHTSNPKGPQ